MANIGVTRMLSKAHIVIPQEMKEYLTEGDKLVVIQNNGRLILKKMEDFKNLEDLEWISKIFLRKSKNGDVVS